MVREPLQVVVTEEEVPAEPGPEAGLRIWAGALYRRLQGEAGADQGEEG